MRKSTRWSAPRARSFLIFRALSAMRSQVEISGTHLGLPGAGKPSMARLSPKY
jgi:hypothetical protein